MASPQPHQTHPSYPRPGSNGWAKFSFLSGITGWINLLLAIGAKILFAALSIATPVSRGTVMGMICFNSPFLWLVAITAGHIGKSQISRTGDAGGNSATWGLLMGYLGLGLALLSFFGIAILTITGLWASIPLFSDPTFWGY